MSSNKPAKIFFLTALVLIVTTAFSQNKKLAQVGEVEPSSTPSCSENEHGKVICRSKSIAVDSATKTERAFKKFCLTDGDEPKEFSEYCTKFKTGQLSFGALLFALGNMEEEKIRAKLVTGGVSEKYAKKWAKDVKKFSRTKTGRSAAVLLMTEAVANLYENGYSGKLEFDYGIEDTKSITNLNNAKLSESQKYELIEDQKEVERKRRMIDSLIIALVVLMFYGFLRFLGILT